MATFSKTTFDTLSYASSRPTYPRSLYNYIFDFHRDRNRRPSQCVKTGVKTNAGWERAVDLGCGTGQATFELTPFTHVIGVDPSENMILSAREATKRKCQLQVDGASDAGSQLPSQNQGQSIQFVHSPAESLDFVADESVDLVIAAQSCHWFDWSRVWPQLARILRKGGTAAAWVYTEFRFPAHPHLTPQILHYSESHDTTSSVGRYWQQPGRSVLSRHLLDVPEPNSILAATTGTRNVFEPLDRVYFTGPYFPELPSSQTLPVLMRKTMTWSDILAYLETWSALHTFREMHPEDAKNSEGPVEVRFWNSLRRGAAVGASSSGSLPVGAGDMVNPDSEVDVEWGVAMILAQKKHDVEGEIVN